MFLKSAIDLLICQKKFSDVRKIYIKITICYSGGYRVDIILIVKYAIKQLFIYSFSSFEIKYCCNFVHFDNRMEINGGIFCCLTGLSELCEQ